EELEHVGRTGGRAQVALEAEIALVEQRGGGAAVYAVAAPRGFDGKAGQPRMQRKQRADPAQRGRRAFRIEQLEPPQKRVRALQRSGRRRVEPGKAIRIEARCAQVENGAGEIEALDLRRMMIGTRIEIMPG